MGGAVSGVTGLTDYRLYVSDQDGIAALDLVAPESVLGQGAAVRDSVTWEDGRVLLLTEENLLVWDGTLRPSPMEEVLSGASVSDIDATTGELWVVGDNGLATWQGGILQTVIIDGETARAPLRAARVDGREVVWVSVDNAVIALARTGDGITALENRPLSDAPDALAVDALGSLWVAAGGRLHRRDTDGMWSVFELPDPVTGVAGSPASTRVWVATEGSVFTAENDEFTALAGMSSDSADWSVDDAGRLVLRDAQGISRASIGRPVAVRGLPSDNLLFATSELYIAPTMGDDVVSVSATLGGSALSVADLGGGVYSATLEPAQLDAGAYDLAVDVDYGSGLTNAQWNLIITNPTWENDIKPLFQERCSACHGGTTGTAVLDSPEAWETNFANIVDRVERNNMPLGLEPLTDVQKGMIRAWGAKGFPL